MASPTPPRAGRRKPEVPFYEGTGAPAAEVIHARVVQGTRAVVRSMTSARPFTPADQGRSLFGLSRGSDPFGVPVPTDRPTSALTIGRKQFLQHMPGTVEPERPSSAARRLAPIAEPPTTPGRRLLPVAPSTPRASAMAAAAAASTPPAATAHAENSDRRTVSATTVPPSPLRVPAPPTHPPPEHMVLAPPPRRSTLHAATFQSPRSPARPSGSAAAASSVNTVSVSFTAVDPATHAGNTDSAAAAAAAAARRSISADKTRVSTAQSTTSALWDEVDAAMGALTSDAEVGVLCDACDHLAVVLGKLPSLASSRRATPVLRSLFRFLDMKDPRLLLKLVRLVLMLTTQGKTVTNACKLLFKLSRDEKNDALFRAEQVGRLVVAVLAAGDLETNAEGLVYACGTLKNIAFDGGEQRSLLSIGAVAALATLLRRLASAPLHGEAAPFASHLLIQLTAALRNLAVDNLHRDVFLQDGVVEALRPFLTTHAEDLELVLNISRILSKLTLHEGSRIALCNNDDTVPKTLLSLVQRHVTCTPLVVRLLFVLGNLTSTDNALREQLFAASDNFAAFFDLLERFDAEDVRESVALPKKAASGANTNSSEEVLVKLVRVLANLAIHADLGPLLAAQPRVLGLVALLQRKSVDTAQELVLNIIGAVNNISFYRGSGNHILLALEQVAEILASFFLNPNMDVVIETARVFGNFSQEPRVCALLKRHRADEIMVVLLGHDNPEVVFTVCGVLMNLMADSGCRAVLKDSDGIASLVDVMARHGGADWQLAGMAAKTLWNFGEGLPDASYASAEDCFGVDQSDALVRVLSDLLDDSLVDEDDYDVWEAEFVPAATALLRRIEAKRESRLETLPPLETDDLDDL